MAVNDDSIFIDEGEPDDEVLVRFDIATYPSDYTLAGIHELWKLNDIEIPEFQRDFVWNIKKSSLLIESFLVGLPVPPVFFYLDDEHKNLVIDGHQRIQSIVYYLEGFFGKETRHGRRQIFRLQGLDKRSPFSGKRFSELTETDQRRLKGSVLRAINVRQLSPANDSTSIYHIFERLNTGGIALKPQEIRNCVFAGTFAIKLRQLNANVDWRAILGSAKLDRHQRDIELVLRLFSLSGRWTEYERPMKEYLNISMRENKNSNSKRVLKFEREFAEAVKLVHEKLGEKPFHVRGPLNTAVLDCVLGTVIAHRTRLRRDWIKRFEKLKEDPEFVASTTASTADENSIKSRFGLAEKHLLSL